MAAYTDEDYRDLDSKAYYAKDNSKYTKKGYEFENKSTGNRYVVVDSHENKTNGFKAYAVVPIKGKKPDYNQNIMKIAKWASSPALAALSVSFQDADGQYHKSIVGEDELNVFVGWQITRAKLITRWDDNE